MASKWDKLKGKYPPTPAGNMSNAKDASFMARVDGFKLEYACLTQAQLLQTLNDIDKEKDELAEAEKEINARLEALGRLILTQFEAQDVSSVKTTFGKTIYTRIEPYVGIENKDAFETHISGIPEYDYLWSVHPSMLASLVKDFLEKGQDEQIPPGLKVFLKTQVCIKKS